MNPVRCPICAKTMDGQGPKEWPDWPFCSPRCKIIDLGRWLGGDYSIAPARDDDESDRAPSPNSADPSAVPHKKEAE